MEPLGRLADPSRRVFTNRNLRMDHIRWVGFDMDYTLAGYHREHIEQLAFRMTAERLVHAYRYPDAVAELTYDPDFVVRGVVVDRKLGNIFKMDRHQHVGRVFHGSRRLDKPSRRTQYRNEKIRLSAPRYRWVDTLFALPEVALYAQLVDFYELRLGVKRVAFGKLFDDVRAAIDACHADGTLKAAIVEDLDRYLPIDGELPDTLHKLRSSGKRLFVLTNSERAYTEAVMQHLLDGRHRDYPRWRSYFDFVITDAAKPGFFTGSASIVSGGRPVDELEPRGAWTGGSMKHLERLLAPNGGEHVLYVGDHIYGDVIRSKKDGLWRTALVVSELERELGVASRLRAMSERLVELEIKRAELDDRITLLKDGRDRDEPERRKAVEGARVELRAIIDEMLQIEDAVDRAYNPYWGSVFKEGSEVTRFGRQVEKFACIYMSRVSNLSCYSPTKYFRAPRHWMAHEKTP